MTELESTKEKDLELDDLLISSTDEDQKGGSGKKIILLSAIGILLFAIVVLVVYLLQGDSKQEAQATPELEKVETPIQVQKENTDYSQVPMQNEQSANSDDQFQRIIDQIKAQQAQQENTAQTLPVAPQNPAPQAQQQPQPLPQAQPQQPQQIAQNTLQQPQPQPSAQPQEQKSPKDTFDGIKANDPALQGSEATKGFYVQVGSFSKFAPNKKLLGLIEKEKYSYRMQKAGDNNRLLIGPYGTRIQAQEQITTIRSKINKDAFIKEIK